MLTFMTTLSWQSTTGSIIMLLLPETEKMTLQLPVKTKLPEIKLFPLPVSRKESYAQPEIFTSPKKFGVTSWTIVLLQSATAPFYAISGVLSKRLAVEV